MSKYKIGVFCDMHLPADTNSPQYFFLKEALKKMKQDGINTIICLGDITGYGEIDAWKLYCDAVNEFKHYEVLGNSDIRDLRTRNILWDLVQEAELKVGKVRIIGINTPDGEIYHKDRVRLADVKDGDIIFLHHYIQSLKEESLKWIEMLAERSALVIIHGHGHRVFDYYINQTHVLGFRGLDPDKCIGNFPSFNYLEIDDETVNVVEHCVKISKDFLIETSKYFGIACADNTADILYAKKHGIKYAEIRCKGDKKIEWVPDRLLIPLVNEWRKKTNGYLSVHMPNLKYKNGMVTGKNQWLQALDYAIELRADSITMHPPRVPVCDLQRAGAVWLEFLEMYLIVAKKVPATTKLGVENMHKNTDEVLDETRGFGYRPEEVSDWISAINDELGYERVGHVLDVGHARNNGEFAKKYPIGRWYSMMGKKAIAYHIHQVVPTADGLKNHRAIESWFGPMINYTSFFYAWKHGRLNHAPVFLEVRGWESFKKSINAFQELLLNQDTDE